MAETSEETALSRQLLRLARSRSQEDREHLLLTVADVCSASGGHASPGARQMLQDVLMGLVVDAEHRIRLQLSERLATAAWAPHGLIEALARDDIDIARPVIAQSPVLTNHDLVRLLVEATVEHQIEVARRPALAEEVVGAVLGQADPDVLAALAGNTSAKVSPLVMSRLVSFSERMAALRAPLVRHPLLTSDLAGLLYGWVGDSLRSALVERFEVDQGVWDRAMSETLHDVHGGPAGWDVSMNPGGETLSDRNAMERRVVQKLQAAGQLRPGLLIRALHEGRLSLFTTALATLGGFTPEAVKAALDAERPERLADACTAVGIDRGAFPTVLSLVRRLNAGRPGAEPDADGADATDRPLSRAPVPRRTQRT